MFADMIIKPALVFSSTLVGRLLDLIDNEWILQKFLHLIEINIMQEFTIPMDFVIQYN
jgi:hypothetical protein